uniref:NADH dehydrogenase subunit 6 n=1 Tax=Dermacentor reticulatus TaxID=57047 RepID=UPI00226C6C0A|nr:NADH dehydrogenase subunit 6 [Dermacentor reticulatus]UZG91453.1 NADH dehydrogenase subunit 6 [Dermacentor reticulatus]UZG91466.1 NADH dehydrogenase subunit 6 [Dermacentor reticulatus]UZG91479.1 NADH dehydrogenase subunit 6 [Dermacentor reticulatus]UZG91492.1 NADH dehydrogenase subunit 6 [Dermacentor reticulatus]UZG91505.1 NADH dehydrogenase subunit 6 [Dermacentor reticulatus]
MKLLILLSILCMSMSHPIMMLMSLILLTLFLSMSFYFLFQFSLVSLLMILIILGGMLIIFMYMISLCPNKKIFIDIKMIIFSILMTIPIYFPFHMMSFNIINIEKIYSINFTNMLILMMLFLIMSLMIISKNLNWINCPIKKYI